MQADSRDTVDGIVTLGVLALALLALDDITTDPAPSHAVEWRFLVLALAWCAALVVRLSWRGRPVIGGAVALLLAAAWWGREAIAPGTVASWRPEYVAVSVSIVGLLLVAVRLLVMGSRRPIRRGASMAG